MKKLLLTIFLLFVYLLTAQNKNILDIKVIEKQIRDSKADTTTINFWNKAADYYVNVEPKKGIEYAKKALKKAEDIRWDIGILESNLRLASNYFSISDFENAIVHFEKVLNANPKKPIEALVQKNLGLCHSYQNDYPKALKRGLIALNLYEELNDKAGIAVALSNIGIVYCDWQKFPEAISYYNKALKINTIIKNDVGLSQNLGNLGNVYALQKNDKKALEYYLKTLAISQKNNDMVGICISQGSVASTYLNLKQFDSAAENVETAIDVAQKIGIEGIIGFLTSIRGDIYFQKGKVSNNQEFFAQAIADFKKALTIHQKIKSQKEISSDLDYLSMVYTYKKDYKKALETYKESIVYRDSVFNQENKETIKNIEDKRTIQLREKELKISQLRKEKQQTYFLIGIFSLIVVGGFIFYQSNLRKKNNVKLQKLVTELDRANKTKAQFFSILNHDLRSPISSLIHFLYLQKNNPELLTPEIQKEIQTETMTTAENLLNSMEDILQWSKSQMKNFTPVFTSVKIENVFGDIEKYFMYEKNIKFIFLNEHQIQINTDENYLKTILRNLTSNAIKAMQKTENAAIIWRAWQENNQFFLSITDNGKGADNQQFRALYDDNEVAGIQSGLGLHLIRDLSKAINCRITVKSKIDHGTTFVLQMNTIA